MQDKVIINDYIENDPLSEENLDKTLKTVDSGFIQAINGNSYSMMEFILQKIVTVGNVEKSLNNVQ